jgi:steroid delta-isomerase-like uncharacterized protein
MTTVENKKVIAMFVEDVINQGQLDRINDLVVDDFVELDPLPGQQQGREGLKEVIGQIRTAFPDVHWVLDEMVAEGDKVFSRFTWSGTHRGSFLGIRATGRRINVKGVVIDRLMGCKMADSRILIDNLSMLQQLGALPTAQTAD